MITVQEADKIIASQVAQYPLADCRIEDACGAILQEDIISDRDQPPFNRSLMDGIAIKTSMWDQGVREFIIEGTQAAGQPGAVLQNDNACYEIMTGAVVPNECDCVIPVEEVTIKDGIAIVSNDTKAQLNRFIRLQGADYKKGNVLIQKGKVLEPVHVAVCAAVGKSKIKVTKKVSIVIISTGNEIVDVDGPIRSFQIRKSNEYALKTLFEKTNLFSADMFHLRDNLDQLKTKINEILSTFDVVVLSGGVSMGKFDLVPQALSDLGVKEQFHRIKQRPGKPMWFGVSQDRKPVFALPGNPISTQICAYRYVLPHLKQALGITDNLQEFAELTDNFTANSSLTQFLPVRLNFSKTGKILATPSPVSGSGDFATLSKADGFVELDGGDLTFKKGMGFPLYRW